MKNDKKNVKENFTNCSLQVKPGDRKHPNPDNPIKKKTK